MAPSSQVNVRYPVWAGLIAVVVFIVWDFAEPQAQFLEPVVAWDNLTESGQNTLKIIDRVTTFSLLNFISPKIAALWCGSEYCLHISCFLMGVGFLIPVVNIVDLSISGVGKTSGMQFIIAIVMCVLLGVACIVQSTRRYYHEATGMVTKPSFVKHMKSFVALHHHKAYGAIFFVVASLVLCVALYCATFTLMTEGSQASSDKKDVECVAVFMRAMAMNSFLVNAIFTAVVVHVEEPPVSALYHKVQIVASILICAGCLWVMPRSKGGGEQQVGVLIITLWAVVGMQAVGAVISLVNILVVRGAQARAGRPLLDDDA